MQGYWTAIARHGNLSHWFWPTWWPYWDAGMPFEWTYAPLVPALTAFRSWMTGTDPAYAFGWISGLFYCLTPVTLFLCATILSGKTITSFAAAALYSLASLSELVVPDGPWKLAHVADARRLYLVAVWDELPHIAALTFIPLVILFTVLALRSNRRRWWIGGALAMALSVSANAFGATVVALTLLSVLAAFSGGNASLNLVKVGAAGVGAWCLIAGWLPLSQLGSMRTAADLHGHGWTSESLTALIAVICVAAATVALFRRHDFWIRFITVFAAILISIPAIYVWTERQFLPQSGRYRMEAEMALALVAAFATEAIVRRTPLLFRVVVIAFALALAVEQTISHRRYEKQNVHSADMTQTIEAKVASYLATTMPEARVAVPGSIAQWLNNFSTQHQFAGSSWSTAYNPEQQKVNSAWQMAQTPEEAQVSLAQLRDFGVAAYAVPGPRSPEFWKAITRPELYSECDRMWQQQDTWICRLPGGGTLVQPSGTLRWLSANEVSVSVASASAAAPIPIRMTWHPGWQAVVNGTAVPLFRDRYGLMVMNSPASGSYVANLTYDGGVELKLTRILMYASWFVLLTYSAATLFRLRKRSWPQTACGADRCPESE